MLFIVQLWYYLDNYGHLHKYRNNKGISSDTTPPPISVVVVAYENSYYFIEHSLPLLLTQHYHTYEVVVVDCSYDEEIGEMLQEAAKCSPHLRLTRISAQPNYKHSNKLAVTVGIKAAQYEQLIFTTMDSYPSSEKWLSLMAKGFIGADVVIGYCAIERKAGFANRIMRCSRLFSSVRYLSAATQGRTYRGIAHNIGYTKSLYFSRNGFNHLNLSTGDDDLFIQTIATRDNVSVIMNPHATVRQMQYGGLGWWNAYCKFSSYAFRFYPSGTKCRIRTELWSRALFFIGCVAAILLLPLWWKAIPAALILVRLLIVELKMWRIGKRLGDTGLIWSYLLYDLVAPLSEAVLSVNRRLRPNKEVWR